jgi:nucleoside-diphosphate-sugar epimerase
MRLSGRDAAAREDRRRIRPAASEVGKLICDNRLAAKLTGWRPRVPLEEGLVRAIEHVRSRLDTYKAGLYNT